MHKKTFILWNMTCLFLFLVFVSPGSKSNLYAQGSGSGPLRSVVKIKVSSFKYNYKTPWNQPRIIRSSGTGFLIKGNLILTNAHVVSGADNIRVSLSFQHTDFKAKLVHIAHDCDLAILKVDDESFFKGSQKLLIGKTPVLNSPVTVIGYPIGGDRVSITRGVVSRLGMDVYSHSQIDSHMTVQVDAAINPGNSGGPALQNGKVIGVAFQSLRSGENLGYLIPPEVIQKFLLDIQDGKYNGYIELGVMYQSTINQALRKSLAFRGAVKSPETGVYVYSIVPGASADGFIFPGDVLLKINGYHISENGDVNLQGARQPYSLVVDNLEQGQKITVEVWRNNKIMKINFEARPTNVFDHMRRNYGTPPDFLMSNGFIFQPLNANLMSAYARSWRGSPDLMYRYNYFIKGRLYKEVDEDVVLTRRLADPVNTYSGRYVSSIVHKINGRKVRNFDEFLMEYDKAIQADARVLIKFRGQDVPLLLTRKEITESWLRIKKRFGMNKNRHFFSKVSGGVK